MHDPAKKKLKVLLTLKWIWGDGFSPLCPWICYSIGSLLLFQKLHPKKNLPMAQRAGPAAAANQAEANELAAKLHSTTLENNRPWGCVKIWMCSLMMKHHISVFVWIKASSMHLLQQCFYSCWCNMPKWLSAFAYKVENDTVESWILCRKCLLNKQHTFKHMYKTPAAIAAGLSWWWGLRVRQVSNKAWGSFSWIQHWSCRTSRLNWLSVIILDHSRLQTTPQKYLISTCIDASTWI